MAINLRDIRDAVLDYFSSRIQASITVTPLSGQVHINPGEQFNITLTAKNSVDHPDRSIRIINTCYHVAVDDVTKATLIVPNSSVAVARENSSPSSAIVEPGKKTPVEKAELYLFAPAPNDSLGEADTDPLTIQGHALIAGTPKMSFHMHGDVDINYLFPTDQQSPTAYQTVEIEHT